MRVYLSTLPRAAFHSTSFVAVGLGEYPNFAGAKNE